MNESPYPTKAIDIVGDDLEKFFDFKSELKRKLIDVAVTEYFIENDKKENGKVTLGFQGLCDLVEAISNRIEI